MSFGQESISAGAFPTAAASTEAARVAFIKKTYAHLAGAIGVFVFLEALLLNLPGIENLIVQMVGSRFSWILVIGAFIGVSYLAERWARSSVSPATQYLGLGLYVVAESIIFLPLLWLAANYGGPNVIPAAAIMTLTLFVGLSGFVLLTGKDFSFLGPMLAVASLGALGLVICGALFGFSLGLVFTVAMIVLASGYVIYDTSNVLHQYRIGQHVAASLALFASVALMFWYILRLVMSLSDRR
jgi:FtsH-binding integral membrane protein